MRIAWFCIPAHGHTNPTLGLVKSLTEAGHQVWYFSFEEFREKIEAAGATFIGCDEYDFDMEDKGNADRVSKDKVYATELIVSSTLALDEMTSRLISEIKPDIVVSDSVAFWGKLAAMKYGLPYVSSTTTFAFNKYSAKYMKESVWDIAKMLLAMPLLVPEQMLEGNGLSGWLGDREEKLRVVAVYTLAFTPRQMVEEGMGVMVTFEHLVAQPGLVFRPLAPPLEAGMYLIWKKHQVFSRAAECLLGAVTGQAA